MKDTVDEYDCGTLSYGSTLVSIHRTVCMRCVVYGAFFSVYLGVEGTRTVYELWCFEEGCFAE